MYKYRKPTKTTIRVNKSYQGERLEQKIDRIVNNKEPIKDGAPIIYEERKAGVNPAHDIRTDRWEYAIDAMDYGSRGHLAKRADRHKPTTETSSPGTESKQISGTEPTQGT